MTHVVKTYAVVGRRLMLTVVVGTLMFLVDVAVGQDADLQGELEAITQKRNTLRGDVQNIDVKLEGAQRKLQDLMRRQAPYADIQLQKERIHGVQREKLKLLTRLLKAEEDRADVLVKKQEVGKKKDADKKDVDETGDDSSTVTDTGKSSEKKVQTGFGATIETNSKTMEEYKLILADAKGRKAKIRADQWSNDARLKKAERQLAELPLNASKGTRNKLLKEIESCKVNDISIRLRLETMSAELLRLQEEFETHIMDSQKNEFIMPGQKLELIVAEDKSFNGEYTVRKGGYIILPRIGRITVAGKIREDAEIAVKDSLEKTQLRIATVLLEAARMDDPKKQTEELQREYIKARIKQLSREDADIGQDVIYLTGAFKRSRPWPIPKNFQPTLLTTIIRGGGVTDEADLSKVRVLRMHNGLSQSETVDVKAMMEGKPGIADIKLRANDIIIITESEKDGQQTIFLTGSVKKPGAFQLSFDKKVTVYTAILRAGGVSRFANLSKVYVLRDEVKIPVDLKKVTAGKVSDPELKPNDIIVVPESFWGTGN